MTNKIYVGNISVSTTDKDLFDLFSLVGQVVSANLILGIDRKRHAGYGYVTMNEEEDSKKAITKYNNTVLKGNRLKVIRAHSIDQKENFFASQNRFRRDRRF